MKGARNGDELLCLEESFSAFKAADSVGPSTRSQRVALLSTLSCKSSGTRSAARREAESPPLSFHH